MFPSSSNAHLYLACIWGTVKAFFESLCCLGTIEILDEDRWEVFAVVWILRRPLLVRS